jgi:hypothetical protein
MFTESFYLAAMEFYADVCNVPSRTIPSIMNRNNLEGTVSPRQVTKEHKVRPSMHCGRDFESQSEYVGTMILF